MWPFKTKQKSSVEANAVTVEDGVTVIDVRGQTCPGYLLAINKAVEELTPGSEARLLITYPPCSEDVKAWAKAQHIDYLGIHEEKEMRVIRIKTPT